MYFNTITRFSNLEMFAVFIHFIAMFLALAGGIMLAFWMFKNLKPQQLLTWIIVAIVVGLLGSFLTFQTGIKFMSSSLNSGQKAPLPNMMQNFFREPNRTNPL